MTPLPDLPQALTVSAGAKQSFYIKLEQAHNLRYTSGNNEGGVYKHDENIEFLEGIGKANAGSDGFGSTYRPRIWNGCIRYEEI